MGLESQVKSSPLKKPWQLLPVFRSQRTQIHAHVSGLRARAISFVEKSPSPPKVCVFHLEKVELQFYRIFKNTSKKPSQCCKYFQINAQNNSLLLKATRDLKILLYILVSQTTQS